MKRTRLVRGESRKKRDRLHRDRISLSASLEDIRKALQEGFEAMSFRGSVYRNDEMLDQNLKVARSLVKLHPNEHILLKVELEEEPESGAGRIMLVRAEDYLNFENVEVEDVDSGHVYTIPRNRIVRIIGRVPIESEPEMGVGGFGIKDHINSRSVADSISAKPQDTL